MGQNNTPKIAKKTLKILPCVYFLFEFNFAIQAIIIRPKVIKKIMQIIVNGEKLDFPNSLNIEEFIDYLGFQNQRIAIEVNEAIVPKSNHSTYTLSNNDRVEVINAVGGG